MSFTDKISNILDQPNFHGIQLSLTNNIKEIPPKDLVKISKNAGTIMKSRNFSILKYRYFYKYG